MPVGAVQWAALMQMAQERTSGRRDAPPLLPGPAHHGSGLGSQGPRAAEAGGHLILNLFSMLHPSRVEHFCIKKTTR